MSRQNKALEDRFNSTCIHTSDMESICICDYSKISVNYTRKLNEIEIKIFSYGSRISFS